MTKNGDKKNGKKNIHLRQYMYTETTDMYKYPSVSKEYRSDDGSGIGRQSPAKGKGSKKTRKRLRGEPDKTQSILRL